MSETSKQKEISPDTGFNKIESASKQLEKLSNANERSVEISNRDNKERAEIARDKALETAISVESEGKEKDLKSSQSKPQRRGAISKKQLNDSYKNTIKHVQEDLSPTSRVFSKALHNKYIEKTSEIVGTTIARPNAILSGGIFAFILTLIAYLTAKNYGYSLSGFETIASFAIGWLIGIIYDYFKLLITGKKT